MTSMRLMQFYVPIGSVAGTPIAFRRSDTVLVDLDEYVHPDARPSARAALVRLAQTNAGLNVIARIPADVSSEDVDAVRAAGIGTLVLADMTSVGQLEAAAEALAAAGVSPDLVVELRSGRALRDAEALASAHPRISAIWYGIADLLVDLVEEPDDLYFFDSAEPRLAAPEWVRSRLLTVARAVGIELWGQLDLSVALPPPMETLRRTLARARLSGFDAVIARHADAVRDAMGSAMPS